MARPSFSSEVEVADVAKCALREDSIIRRRQCRLWGLTCGSRLLHGTPVQSLCSKMLYLTGISQLANTYLHRRHSSLSGRLNLCNRRLLHCRLCTVGLSNSCHLRGRICFRLGCCFHLHGLLWLLLIPFIRSRLSDQRLLARGLSSQFFWDGLCKQSRLRVTFSYHKHLCAHDVQY